MVTYRLRLTILFLTLIFTFLYFDYRITEAENDDSLFSLPVSDEMMDEQGLIYSIYDKESATNVTDASDDKKTNYVFVSGYTHTGNFIENDDGKIIIPDCIIHDNSTYVVKSVDVSVFAKQNDLISLFISDSVESISNITASNILFNNVHLGKSIKLDYGETFYNWTELATITVSEGNNNYSAEIGILYDKNKETIISFPNKYCSTSYYVPESVKNIGACAFRNNTSLEIVYGFNVLSIGESAFQNSAIYSTKMEMVNYVGKKAFYNCANLKCLDYAKDVFIDDKAYYYCSSLGCVYIPGDAIINSTAFCYLSNLKVVVIDKGVNVGTRLDFSGNGEFFECPDISSIYFPKTMTYINGMCNTLAVSNSKIKYVYIPTGVTSCSNFFDNSSTDLANRNPTIYYFENNNNVNNTLNYTQVYADEYVNLSIEYYNFDYQAENVNYVTNVSTLDLKKATCTGSEASISIYDSYVHFDKAKTVSLPLNKEVGIGDSIIISIEFIAFDSIIENEPLLFELSDSETDVKSDICGIYSKKDFLFTNDSYNSYDTITFYELHRLVYGEKPYRNIDINVNKVTVEYLTGYEVARKRKETMILPETDNICEFPTDKIYNYLYSECWLDKIFNKIRYKTFYMSSYSSTPALLMLRFDEPKNISEYEYIVIDILAVGLYNVKLKTSKYFNDGDNLECTYASVNGISLPAVLSLKDMLRNGKDYNDIISIAITPHSKVEEDIVVSSVKLYKNYDDIPEVLTFSDITISKPTPTPKSTSKPATTKKPASSATPKTDDNLLFNNNHITNDISSNNSLSELVIQSDDFPSNTIINYTGYYNYSNKNKTIKPQFKLTKGKNKKGIKYIKIKLTRYFGKYIEIYVKTGSKFKRVKLKTKKISAIKSALKLKYSGNKKQLYVKVRTYSFNGNKKIYSSFSKTQKVRM